MQEDVTEINSEIKAITEENEALKLDLLKVGNIDNIRNQAEKKLGMVMATKDNRIEVEIPSNYFDDKKSDDQEDKSGNETLFSKLMDALN
jgi:2-methylaconitate cis-trans-isomerase PrpF